MREGVLDTRAGALVLVGGPPWRPRRPRPSRAIAGSAPRLVGPVSIVASCASIQTAAALATSVFVTFGQAGTGALRFLAAAATMLVAVRPRLRGRSRASWLAIAALGAITAVTNLLLYGAIARIPLGAAATLVFLGPLSLALLGSRRRLDVAWAAAALIGVVLVTGAPQAGSALGVACALGAAAGVAAATLILRHVGEQTNGLEGLTLAIGFAALFTLPLGVPAALAGPHLGDLAIVAVIGVLGIAFPWALELDALQRVGVKTYGILLSLDPAIACLAGLLLLGQQLQVGELLGITLVTAASAGAVAAEPAT